MNDSLASQPETPPTRPPAAAEPSPSPLAEAPDGYEILCELGEGGMGVVYRARDVALDRPVALKYVHARHGTHPAAVARFAHEARVTARLQHPGIPPVYEVGALSDGRPFLAMKLIEGRTLDALLRERGAGADRWLAEFEGVCQAVGYAHAQGVIHRDLKPGNVMVGAYGEVQVMDWGLAKVLAPRAAPAEAGEVPPTRLPGIEDTPALEATRAGTVLGTPAYMPPEQAIGAIDKLDRRSDVFGLGAILCELLTGAPPFVGGDGEAVRQLAARARLEDAFARLDACGAEAELVALAKHCMAAEQDDRHSDGGAVAAQVAGLRRQAEQRARQAEMEAARVTVRAEEQRRRRRLWRTAAAVVAVVLVAGIVGTTIGMLRARQSAFNEEQAKEQAQRRSDVLEKQVTVLASFLQGLGSDDENLPHIPHYERMAVRAYWAAEELEAGLVDDPIQVARLQTMLGRTLVQLGSALKAILVLEKARKTRERELGPNHRDTLETLAFLADAYHEAGQTSLAIGLYQRVVKERTEQLGADDGATLAASNGLANAYQEAGRFPEAIALLERVRDVQARTVKPDDPNALAVRGNLARAYGSVGRVAEAIKLHEENRDADMKKFHPNHPATLITLHNLAVEYVQDGRLLDAIKLLEFVRDARTKKWGADHPDTLTAASILGMAYVKDNRVSEAITLLEQTHKASVKKLGADHPSTLNVAHHLAEAYLAAGRLADAIKLFGEVLVARTKIGPNNPATLATTASLANAYRVAGRPAEAIKIFESVSGRMISVMGADNQVTLNVLGNLAAAYQDAGRLPDAIGLLERVREQQTTKFGPDHPDVLNTSNNLALAYQAAKDFAKALPLFEETAVRIEKRKFVHEHAGRVVPSTIAAYEQAEQFEKAEAWRRKWLAFIKGKAGGDSAAYAGELAALGLNLLRQKKWADAEKPIRESLALRQKKSPEAWTTFSTRSLLGGALLGQKKYEEAEKLLLDGYQGLKKREKSIPPQAKACLPEAVDRLIDLYAATEKPDEVEKWQAERARYAKQQQK